MAYVSGLIFKTELFIVLFVIEIGVYYQQVIKLFTKCKEKINKLPFIDISCKYQSTT
jgi:hypothetical protein